MKIYIERKIESESDLPKVSEMRYFVYWKHFGMRKIWLVDDPKVKESWLNYVVWYLEPIEISEPHEHTQFSGLTDFELSVEKIVDEIKSEQSTLACIRTLIYEMKLFAAQEVAKDRAEHLLLEVKTQPTDEDIEEWAENRLRPENDPIDRAFHSGLIAGAKAALNGEIKKKEK